MRFASKTGSRQSVNHTSRHKVHIPSADKFDDITLLAVRRVPLAEGIARNLGCGGHTTDCAAKYNMF